MLCHACCRCSRFGGDKDKCGPRTRRRAIYTPEMAKSWVIGPTVPRAFGHSVMTRMNAGQRRGVGHPECHRYMNEHGPTPTMTRGMILSEPPQSQCLYLYRESGKSVRWGSSYWVVGQFEFLRMLETTRRRLGASTADVRPRRSFRAASPSLGCRHAAVAVQISPAGGERTCPIQ